MGNALVYVDKNKNIIYRLKIPSEMGVGENISGQAQREKMLRSQKLVEALSIMAFPTGSRSDYIQCFHFNKFQGL